MICISSKNVAPTTAHPTHHMYSFHIDPASGRPFVFEESIGGGHAERGGAIALSLDQLETWPGNWRQHLELAGAVHVITHIEDAQKKHAQHAIVTMLLAKEPIRSDNPVLRTPDCAAEQSRDIL